MTINENAAARYQSCVVSMAKISFNLKKYIIVTIKYYC